MRRCQHCGAGVPNYAGFCGECGQLVSIGKPAAREQTLWMSHSVSPDKAQKTVITETESGNEEAGYVIEEEDTGTKSEEEEEEEKRHRSVLVDFSLPLLADGIAGQSTVNVPMVQGTPQIVDAPTIPGTPSIGSRLLLSGGSTTAGPLILPDPEQVFTGPLVHGPYFDRPPSGPPQGTNGPQPHGPNKPHPQPSGCMVWLLVAIIVPIIILASVIGAAFTLFAPTLSLDGSTSVTAGGTLHLLGGHFIPGNSVTCMLDGSIPLYASSATYPTSQAPHITGALILAHQRNVTAQTAQTRETDAKTTIIVGSDGTFSATFVVGQDWKAGQHTIRATEAFSPQSATTTFTVTGNVQPTGTTTSSTTPTATKTAKGTPSATPTAQTQSGLNAITPNSITFGPISPGYTQPISTQVLLNTTGTDVLNWTASWDTVQAPWLRLNVKSGQVQEPNDQAIIVSAVVGTLNAGTYNATILFSSNGKNGQNLSLPVSLTVQAGCLKAMPATLNFTGIIGGNDPASQTLTLNNCGAVGNWSEAATGGSWLLVSPAGGNLNKGATQSIIISATLANLKSGAGTYQGQIVFKNGAAQAVVTVIFTVASLPTLGINTTSFSVSNSQQCKLVKRIWQCTIITLSNSATAISNLDWTAFSSGVAAITIKPASGTLQPGQTIAIEIDIPRFSCTNTATVTFIGPTNSVTVTISC